MKGGAKQRASNFVVVKVAALVEQFLFFFIFLVFWIVYPAPGLSYLCLTTGGSHYSVGSIACDDNRGKGQRREVENMLRCTCLRLALCLVVFVNEEKSREVRKRNDKESAFLLRVRKE